MECLQVGRLIYLLSLTIAGFEAQHRSTPLYDEPYRPQYHFSPRQNWTNDPNGLVYFEGEYHLFFQFNPLRDEWGHMSWGHAVSRDLLHWRELPVALPEENGIMIFTGSTVIDQRNTSGFCTGKKPCLIAVYTGYAPPKGSKSGLQTQNLAFSNDRGRTWTKYEHNPVLNLNLADFRDPKVFWSDQAACWVMLVSLPNDHKVAFYRSPDLKHWNHVSDFGPAGATGGQWECPELFELPVDGSRAKTRWVLKVGLNPGGLQGGSGEQYFIGSFDGARFVNDNPSSLTLWTDYGKDCYCALTLNGLPRNQPQVMIGWMNNWQCAAAVPTHPWRGQMTIPRKLSLRTTIEGVRLVEQPIKSLQALRSQSIVLTNQSIEELNRNLSEGDVAKGRAFELDSTISLGRAEEVGWKLLTADGSYLVVGYNQRNEKVFVDRTHAGVTAFSKDFPARTAATLPLHGDSLRLEILVDRCSVEIFAQGGRVTITDLVFPLADARGIRMYLKGGQPGPVSVNVSNFRSVYSIP
ncbi:MAG: glycoside hydrolase family 32 protein [Acidobacteriaceae bacterium]|nr:glycoside hydrolase family 32 protein [Acidobacteriaceae bacterium]MBV9778930.1 glycoside hydrolase family 32 protein [Acidobacteriaceae bacterium]